MPVRVKLKTFPFKDEEGTVIPDAEFTIRTSLSHRGRNEYMQAITAETPDLSSAIVDGKPNPDFKPKVGVGTIRRMEEVLLSDALLDLRGVVDATGKEVKTWEEFLNQDSFVVEQVLRPLHEIARASVEKSTPNPNVSAPSAEL